MGDTPEEVLQRRKELMRRAQLRDKALAMSGGDIPPAPSLDGQAPEERPIPGVGLSDRAIIKNLSQNQDPRIGLEYLKKLHPDMEFQLYQDRIYGKAPGAEKFTALDPNDIWQGGVVDTLKELGKDTTDVGYDVAAGLPAALATLWGAKGGSKVQNLFDKLSAKAQSRLPGAGRASRIADKVIKGAAKATTLPPYTLAGASAGSGGGMGALELGRVALGQMMGLPQTPSEEDFKSAGLIGAVAPSIFGSGARAAAKPAANALTKAMQSLEPKVTKQIERQGRGLMGRAHDFGWEKAYAPLWSYLTKTPLDAIKVIQENPEFFKKLEETGPVPYGQSIHKKAQDALNAKIKPVGSEIGKLLESAQVNIAGAKNVLKALIAKREEVAPELMTAEEQQALATAKALYNDLFTTMSPELDDAGKAVVDDSGAAVMQRVEIPDVVPGTYAQRLSNALKAKGKYHKLDAQEDSFMGRFAEMLDKGQKVDAELGGTASQAEAAIREQLRGNPDKNIPGIPGMAGAKDRYSHLKGIQERAKRVFTTQDKAGENLGNLAKKANTSIIEDVKEVQRELPEIPILEAARNLNAYRHLGKQRIPGFEGFLERTPKANTPLGWAGMLGGASLGGFNMLKELGAGDLMGAGASGFGGIGLALAGRGAGQALSSPESVRWWTLKGTELDKLLKDPTTGKVLGSAANPIWQSLRPYMVDTSKPREEEEKK